MDVETEHIVQICLMQHKQTQLSWPMFSQKSWCWDAPVNITNTPFSLLTLSPKLYDWWKEETHEDLSWSILILIFPENITGKKEIV